MEEVVNDFNDFFLYTTALPQLMMRLLFDKCVGRLKNPLLNICNSMGWVIDVWSWKCDLLELAAQRNECHSTSHSLGRAQISTECLL